jgi:hypothetical protein
VMDHTIEGEKVVVRVEAAILAEQHP